MTVRTPEYLKTRFETGDEPTATDFEDVFDSFLPLGSSAQQTILGGISAPFVSAQRATFASVEATKGEFTVASAATLRANVVSAANLYADNFVLTSISFATLEAGLVSCQVVNASVVNSGTVSAQQVNTSVARVNNLQGDVQLITVLGSTTSQAVEINRYISVVNNTAALAPSAVIMGENIRNGTVYQIVRQNVGTAFGALRVFPASGKSFQGLSAGQPILSTASITTIIHASSQGSDYFYSLATILV